MKNILIPNDFSDLSGYAYDIAQKVSAATKGKIHTLNVIDVPGETLFDPEGNLLDCTEFDVSHLRTEQATAEEKMNNWVAERSSEIESTVKIGRLMEDILKYAAEHEIELIVMGTHGATGAKELFSQSISEQLVRFSPVPVLTLKCNRSDLELTRILIPGDFREKNEGDLKALKEIHKAFNAEIHLLTINSKQDFQKSGDILKNMKTFAEENGFEKFHTHIWNASDVEEGIKDFCFHHEMDLVGMGTHQRKGIALFLKGSVSEDTVNHLYKPILTYRLDK